MNDFEQRVIDYLKQPYYFFKVNDNNIDRFCEVLDYLGFTWNNELSDYHKIKPEMMRELFGCNRTYYRAINSCMYSSGELPIEAKIIDVDDLFEKIINEKI